MRSSSAAAAMAASARPSAVPALSTACSWPLRTSAWRCSPSCPLLAATAGAAASASERRRSAAASLAWRAARAVAASRADRQPARSPSASSAAARRCPRPCQPRPEPGRRRSPGRPGPGQLRCRAPAWPFSFRLDEQELELLIEAGHLGAGGLGLPAEFLFHGLEALGAKEALQQLQAVGGLGAQEGGEVALRQHRNPGELFPVHARGFR